MMKNETKFKRLIIFSHFRSSKDEEGYDYITGGFGRQIEELSKYFKEVKIIALKPEKIVRNYKLTQKNIKIHLVEGFDQKKLFGGVLQYFAKYFYYKRTLKRIISKMSDTDLALVYNTGNYISAQAACLVKKSGKNHFVRFISDWMAEYSQAKDHVWFRKLTSPFISPILDKLTRTIIKDSLTIYSGEVIYKEYEKQFGAVSSSISEKDIVKSDHSCKSSPYSVIYVGLLGPKKGVQYLIEAIDLIRAESNKKVYLKIAGQGPEEKRLKSIVKQKKLGDIVEFLGTVQFGKPLFDHYLNSDFAVVPSVWDKQPKSSFEPMAFGTPVIATNVGSIPKYVIHKKTGLLVKPQNSDDIKKAILELIQNKKLRRRIIINAYDQIKKMTVEGQIKQMIELINNEYPN